MAFFKKLFGGGNAEPKAEPKETYKDFTITARPIKEGAVYRIAAVIEKEIAGEVKTHQLIRADTLNDPDAAKQASVDKAKQVIDQMGDRLF